MTQNRRVASYIPTADDADLGEVIEIRGASGAGKVIPTRFFAQAGSAGGALVDAPADGEYYARRDEAWEIVVGDSPNDGQIWARQGDGWVVSPPFPEAPQDGKQYARSNASWVIVTSMPAVIDGGTF